MPCSYSREPRLPTGRPPARTGDRAPRESAHGVLRERDARNLLCEISSLAPPAPASPCRTGTPLQGELADRPVLDLDRRESSRAVAMQFVHVSKDTPCRKRRSKRRVRVPPLSLSDLLLPSSSLLLPPPTPIPSSSSSTTTRPTCTRGCGLDSARAENTRSQYCFCVAARTRGLPQRPRSRARAERGGGREPQTDSAQPTSEKEHPPACAEERGTVRGERSRRRRACLRRTEYNSAGTDGWGREGAETGVDKAGDVAEVDGTVAALDGFPHFFFVMAG